MCEIVHLYLNVGFMSWAFVLETIIKTSNDTSNEIKLPMYAEER